jgi:hypothetical protein
VNPLAHVRLSRKTIRIRRSDFDTWMLSHAGEDTAAVDRLVDEVLR